MNTYYKSTKEGNDKFYSLINSGKAKILLDVGCGRLKYKDSIGIDAQPYPGADLIGDALSILKNIDNEKIDEIYTRHFLEHIENLDQYLQAFHRILKPDGKLTIIVPHFSNPYFWSDPTHKIHFGLYTMAYYFDCSNILKRSVPTYANNNLFYPKKIQIRFMTPRRKSLTSLLKKLLTKIVNSNYRIAELYEEMFCFVLPCYELEYNLIKTNNAETKPKIPL